MAHEKVAVPAVEFAMGALLTVALIPRTYRRDISHGEIVWHTNVLKSAGISNPCDAIREERRTIPKGGPGDHTFFKVKAEKSFVLQDLRLAAHRQKELGEVTWPTPRDADPASWGPTWQHKEDKEDKDARSELKRESADQSADQSAERASSSTADSALINVLLEDLLETKDALRSSELKREELLEEAKSELKRERTRSEAMEAKTEIKRERTRSRRRQSQRSGPVIAVSPVRAPLKGKAPPTMQPHRRPGAGS